MDKLNQEIADLEVQRETLRQQYQETTQLIEKKKILCATIQYMQADSGVIDCLKQEIAAQENKDINAEAEV